MPFAGGKVRSNHFPFLVRQVACVTQARPLILGASDCSPHIVFSPLLGHKRENHNTLKSLNSFRVRHLGDPRSDPGGNDPKVISYAGKARVFATSTETEFQDAERSVKFAEKAVDLENRVRSPAYKILHRDTLAAAYAAASRFDDATQVLGSALALAAENGWGAITVRGETLATILQRHHQQFTQGMPVLGGIY